MSERWFGLHEANALLPQMERVFARLDNGLQALLTARDRIAVLDALWGGAVEEPGNPDHGELLAHRGDLEKIARAMESVIESEILERGIRLPGGGIEHGLLDFPARLYGRPVFLCWRRGEPEITHWHELDGGFAGRKPIRAGERAQLTKDLPAAPEPEPDTGRGRDPREEHDPGDAPGTTG